MNDPIHLPPAPAELPHPDPVTDEWADEAVVMFNAGCDLRERAFTLPSSSAVRTDLLATADAFLHRARLRGVRKQPLST